MQQTSSNTRLMVKKVGLLLAALALALTIAASSAVAQQATSEPSMVRGTITEIQDRTVLVEENPSAAGTGEKGYFNVTEETEIVRREGDETVSATFEELNVGQLVEAAYAGAVGASYPSVGEAGRIVILQESSGSGEPQPQCFLPEGCFLSGDASDETIVGGIGPDYIIGGGGHDALHGLGGGDWLDGGAGDDLVRGNAGGDLVDGGSGHDLVRGNDGNDYVTGYLGNDILDAGGGSDYVYAADGEFDEVSGGPQYDVCVVDWFDEVRGCEEVYTQ